MILDISAGIFIHYFIVIFSNFGSIYLRVCCIVSYIWGDTSCYYIVVIPFYGFIIILYSNTKQDAKNKDSKLSFRKM
jgi:hypothetical protein